MVDVSRIVSRGNELRKDFEEKKGDWKSKLSGAFNSEQIFFSLFVLGLFYTGYTIGNAYFDTKAKHEDDITEHCNCKSSHYSFYRSWFAICCFLWLILHSYTYIAIRFPPCGNFLKFLKVFSPKDLWKYSKQALKCCNEKCKNRESENIVSEHPVKSNHQPKNKNADKIQRAIKVLWFQYYKLFVVGYPKGNKEIDLDSKSTDENASNKRKKKEKVTCLCCYAYIDEEKGEDAEQEEDCTCGCDEKLDIPVDILRFINHSFLLAVKFSAQLSTIPLLFLQIFDTYSLLCFSPQLFCSDATKYKLHLAQAAITLLFYCCLALSQLTSMMLTWNPWPRKNSADS